MIPAPAIDLRALAPELVVLAAALLVLVADLFLRQERKRLLAWPSLIGVLLAAAASFYLRDGTEPMIQDMLAADGYALFLNLAILAGAALAILFSVDYAERTGLAQGEYYILLLLAVVGMMLMAAAINLTTLFLALEIVSLALYVLVGLDRADPRSAEAAMKYFLLGALASGFVLFGMALVYGQTAALSLSPAGLAEAIDSSNAAGDPGLLAVGLGLMIVGLGFKLALVPFHMWAPDVYQGAPTSVTAFMSAGVKVAGFAALWRVVQAAVFLLGVRSPWHWMLAVLAALTMTVGNLTALRQTSLKRMLAYSGIAQAGYVLVGLAAASDEGMAGALFYLFAYVFTNVAAFAVIIAVGRLGARKYGGETLGDFAGLATCKPGLAAAMAVCMLSLVGLPPLAGFLGKLYVFSAAVQAGLVWLAMVGVLNSVVSAYYYLRVVAVMFRPNEAISGEASKESGGFVCPALQIGVAIAVAVTFLLGVWPRPILDLARTAIALLVARP